MSLKINRVWTILLISAITDAIISLQTSLNTAMMASGVPKFPSGAVWFLILLGAFTAFARTVQQAVKKETNGHTLLDQGSGDHPTPTDPTKPTQ